MGKWEDELLKQLPKKPDAKTVRFAQNLDEIMPPMIIYARESVPDCDYYLQLTGLDIREEQYHWGAGCFCTACGESFYAGWNKGKIAITQMEDGNLLEGWIPPEEDYETVEFGEGQEMHCPRCGRSARAVRRSGIRGRTFRTRIAELTNIGSTTVILYWLASRWLQKSGYGNVQFEPEQAIALSNSGKLQRYGWEWETGWRKRTKWKDPESVPFNGGGDAWNRYTGAYFFNNAGDMAGVSGEKTGIDCYFNASEAAYAASYLKAWRKTPTIEALTKTGAGNMVSDYLREKRNWAESTNTSALDFREKKPHRIAGLKKEEYRFIIKDGWKLSLLAQYHAYRDLWPKTTVEQFSEWAHLLDERRMEEFRKYYADGIGKICRYLKKHWENENIGYYLDYRRMLSSVKQMTGITAPLTEEEKFPRDLIAAHDRVMDAQAAITREMKKKGTPEQIKTFAGIKKKFAPLEWRSGEFCIVIPASPEDLIREGDILHHCVGGYASQHCSGRMIFFVRHARRPERSWYTLNEDVTGTGVKRIQLHGYRNEMVRGKTLTIPKEVTDFVLRWEMEVLAPYLKNKGRISA